MKRIKVIILLSLVICLFAFTGICFSQDYMFTVGTAGAGGTFNYIGSALSNFISQKIDNIEMRAVTSLGGMANIRLLKDGDVDFALGIGLSLMQAYEGEEPWEEPQKNLRAITRLHASTIHFVVPKDSGIKSFEDLRGKKGNLSVAGATDDIYFRDIMEFVDVDVDEVPVQHLGYPAGVDLLRDGHIDWIECAGTPPESNVMTIASIRDIDILDIGGEFREKILKKFPYYSPATIPAGIYKGVDRDVETIEPTAVLFCDESQSEDVVYEITKCIFENIDEVRKLHAGLNLLSLDNATKGVGIPLHPGAEKYYREVGVIN